jgi:hypothetical protein
MVDRMTAPLPSPDAEPRMFASEVALIAKVSRVTVQRRINDGKLPKPVDRGKEDIFDRRAIYQALGIALESGNHAPTDQPEDDPWLRGANAIAERRASSIRCAKKARRKRGFLLSGSGTASA